MIVNMKFLTITGPEDRIDTIAEKYLSKYDIQLENALSELKDVQKLRPFTGTNPYKEAYNIIKQYTHMLGDITQHTDADMSYEQVLSVIDEVNNNYSKNEDRRKTLSHQLEALKAEAETLFPFRELEYDLSTILNFHYIRFSFGHMPIEQYEKFQKFIYDKLDVLFIKCQEREGYVWGVYFMPRSQEAKIDAVFSSLHFEKIILPENCIGTPNETYLNIQQRIGETQNDLDNLNTEFISYLKNNSYTLVCAKNRLEILSSNYDLRKLAARTNKEDGKHFILCGWASGEDAEALMQELENEPDFYCIIDQEHASTLSTPPTRLKNPGLFKPFEMYIKMYGLPAYNEIDPTIFVALTYSFIFGIMFGDVGQGLCLCIGGFLLYRFKNMSLAAIISCCGIFSTVFGFMFGSIFGFEDIIEPIWLRPGIQMSSLPFIGRMNTILVVTIAFGMGIILLSMVLHIINALKQKNISDALFDTNGAAGLVFYASLVLVVVLFMTGHALPASILMAVMFGLPLLLIALKEPISSLLRHKSKLIEGGVGMFIVQTFFELFEVLLSYLSNTISFVRVGAFAISHAAMMEVVLMLAGAENGSPNWLVIVLGNIFVCGLEGLIVGIQVLRLEYYELFSRFYQGNGREFKPYKVK